MKIPKKQKVQQIAFNHLSDIDFEGFMNIYRKFTTKPSSYLVIGSTLTKKKKKKRI